MRKEDLRIVFMGTPEFAVESLRLLVDDGYRVVGVVTMPDKPMGRHGSELQSSPVKKYALSRSIPVLQPEKLKDDTFLEALRALKADLQLVVAFRMLPEAVWNMPPLGTINLHASLLPHYRGAAPINWAIINGETETGVTTFFLTHAIDTGKIILQKRIPISAKANAGELHDLLMRAGARLVAETVSLIQEDKANAIAQETLCANAELLPAPKLFKDTCRIDWQQPAKNVYDFIRGLSPYPAAWTNLLTGEGKPHVLKIVETDYLLETHSHPAGQLLSEGKHTLKVAVKDGYVLLETVQLAGKKTMRIADFLNGFQRIESCKLD